VGPEADSSFGSKVDYSPRSSPSTRPEVYLIKPGSLLRDEAGNLLDARSSVALVISVSRWIIVDTGLEGEEKEILQGLQKLSIRPEEIDTVINTHSHPDHCGNNYLFSRAAVLCPKKEDQIAPGVRIVATPGHSQDSISVVVDSDRRVVISGDALPTFNNFIKGVPPAFHIDKEMAVKSMSRLEGIAEVVVPGHDRPFSLSEKRYIDLP
jgi:glyoxylase-like metal-dependent hydrolase (beta-lactamase superfamily II)